MLGWWRRWRERRARDDGDRREGGRTDRERADRDQTGHDHGEHDHGEHDHGGPAAHEPDHHDEHGVPLAPTLTDELDLHTFLPRECADVVDEYLRAAQEAGLQTVRIIHGKGTGTLRRIVHGVLERHPAVRAFRLADGQRGGWGATLVELRDGPA